MILRGPFNLKWGANTLAEIESIDVEHDLDSEDYQANSGHTYQIDKSIKSSVRVTLLATDIPSLAAILPQYFIPEGGDLATGEIVSNPNGAIDLVPNDCDTEFIHNDLDIINCGDPEDIIRIVRCRTVIDGIEVGKIRKIVVKFIGEPMAGESAVQLLGGQDASEFLLLDDSDAFLLDEGELLTL